MQITSDLFKTLWLHPLHEEEIRLDIAGVSYSHDSIVSVSVNGGMFDKPDIGNCASRQIDLEIMPKEEIPRQAQIKVFLRLRLGDQVTEWLPQGVFFISTRSTNKIDNTLTIHGFDAMLKASQVWITELNHFPTWPITETQAVNDIAAQMNVQIDPRTTLGNKFMVNYPIEENSDMTMMDILECIAVANHGNWIITNEGKLLLLRYGDIPTETNYLVTERGNAILIGGLRILV